MNGREKNSEYFRQQKKLFPSEKRRGGKCGRFFFIAELFRLVFLSKALSNHPSQTKSNRDIFYCKE